MNPYRFRDPTSTPQKSPLGLCGTHRSTSNHCYRTRSIYPQNARAHFDCPFVHPLHPAPSGNPDSRRPSPASRHHRTRTPLRELATPALDALRATQSPTATSYSTWAGPISINGDFSFTDQLAQRIMPRARVKVSHTA